eukprot:9486697-Pyramimonas_sp.AAC.1
MAHLDFSDLVRFDVDSSIRFDSGFRAGFRSLHGGPLACRVFRRADFSPNPAADFSVDPLPFDCRPD